MSTALQKAIGDLADTWEKDLKPRIDGQDRAIDDIKDRLDILDVRGRKGAEARASFEAKEQRGPFLNAKQSIAPHFATEPRGDINTDNVRLGALVAALGFGEKYRKQVNDDETKTLLSLTGAGGDFTVPEGVQGPFIDAIRAKTRVLQAGAYTLPMKTQTVRIPGWANPITSSWAGEFVALPDGGGTFKAINLVSRAVGCVVSLSTELIEDGADNIGDISERVESEISKANALAIDRAALIGAGTQDEPLGLYPKPSGRPDVLVQSLGANGAVPTNYDFLIQLVGALRANNFDPNAIIYSPRTEQELGVLKDTTNRYLNPPSYLDNVALLPTGQIPTNFTKGSSSAASIAVAGQWDQMVIGFRPDASIRVIRDPYSAAPQRVVRLVCWTRCDIGLFQNAAFAVADGIN